MENRLLDIIKFFILISISFISFGPPVISKIANLEVMNLPFKFMSFDKDYNFEIESLHKIHNLKPLSVAIPTLENLQELLSSYKNKTNIEPSIRGRFKRIKER